MPARKRQTPNSGEHGQGLMRSAGGSEEFASAVGVPIGRTVNKLTWEQTTGRTENEGVATRISRKELILKVLTIALIAISAWCGRGCPEHERGHGKARPDYGVWELERYARYGGAHPAI